MTEKQKREIAAIVAEILAGTQAPAAEPKAAPAKKQKARAGGISHKGAKFTFTLVQAGIRGGAFDKYSVRVERDGKSHERGWKLPAGTPVSEYATGKRLDLIAGLTAKYFA
ncbi:hypothetical protein UFOVP1344_36 [uncultured Caudovirales phage]|uniref:Uncharacterized protein n=1 Tax=uncultured Caudovirales phage TaxID=2100421 RepID=A0A6J5SRH4_9CAUD|nr:hypothetical protein UFOVP1005_36 [uncultured Caudovirales phage]CAB4200250.1 hypothetical protein UFOVP1344_36 [uncultured Caudovirales phage]CAB4218073.1 hypothetical protein UFOVP1602_4 [uncultured Caudovirales phage]